ncbi:MAG: threonylcarbamoyl-AMP synthase [Armatimonadetes bacterium]|nr:threonylcarbamoyl-AMP synthase [Armatimonadota bacterium]
MLKAGEEAAQEAARVLAEGGVAVLPTETVYGLACDATNPAAIAKVYAAKGRPGTNPLIVHVDSIEMAMRCVSEWPLRAQVLSERFWPGPLTLVLPRSSWIPLEATAKLDTVAVRVPASRWFREVIRLLGRPVAAPSANPYMGLSPTRVEHLDPELLKLVDLVLDDGPSRLGLESTVVDLSGESPALLRPGGISRAEIESALGGPLNTPPNEGPARSPGLHRRHYSPKARLELVDRLAPERPGLGFGPPVGDLQIEMPLDPEAYGAALYDALHRLDQLGVSAIEVEAPPESPEWEAVWDRLRRAVAPAEP